MLISSIDLQTFSQQINENGFTIFVSGILFTLSTYHFMLYFQHKNKAYLFYALYTFFVLLHSYYRADYFFVNEIMNPLTPHIKFFHASIKWSYSTLYLLFAISFIDLHKYNLIWDIRIKTTIQFSVFFIVATSILSYFLNSQKYTEYAFNFFFMPILFVFFIIVLVLIRKVKMITKNYLFVGFVVFFVLAITTQILDFIGYSYRIIFYTGIVFEATLFALGLGAKQRSVLVEKNTAQRKLIKEHKRNLNLKEQIEIQLDNEVDNKTKEIIALTKRKEEEHKKKLALDYSKKTLNLRMKALQTQMNPHFLFNSLNSIKHFIIKNKKEDASFYLSKLSKLIRKILDNSQLKEISLEEELDIMELYLKVENIRLDKQIRLEVDIVEGFDTEKVKIPPMVLQPFIENAIWHGLALKKGEKEILIRVIKKPISIQITITDNGIGRERAAILKAAKLIEKKSLGIELTRQRLEAFTEYFPNKATIKFKDLYNKKNQPIGTSVHIEIPSINN
jgi:sensor histidine kinase YesM